MLKSAHLVSSRIVWSIGEAERLKGGNPPCMPEVVIVFHHNYTRFVIHGFLVAFINNLYREDLFYADEPFNHYSLTNEHAEGRFEKFSDRFRRLYPGYVLNSKMHIVACPETPVINLKRLMELLKSSDEELWQRSKWMFDGHYRYLDGEPNPSQKVAFCSFPRSGNTFLRRYLELLTGI